MYSAENYTLSIRIMLFEGNGRRRNEELKEKGRNYITLLQKTKIAWWSFVICVCEDKLMKWWNVLSRCSLVWLVIDEIISFAIQANTLPLITYCTGRRVMTRAISFPEPSSPLSSGTGKRWTSVTKALGTRLKWVKNIVWRSTRNVLLTLRG